MMEVIHDAVMELSRESGIGLRDTVTTVTARALMHKVHVTEATPEYPFFRRALTEAIKELMEAAAVAPAAKAMPRPSLLDPRTLLIVGPDHEDGDD